MPATVSVNFLTVVHKSSGGVSIAFPDPCKTPTPAGPVPIPYPNVASSADTADGSKTVKADGNPVMLKKSNFKMSSGDEAGSAQGVASNKIKGKAMPLLFSFDVKFDGENVFRMTDMMLQNSGSPANTPPAAEVQAPAPVIDVDVPETSQEPSIDTAEWAETSKKCGDVVRFNISTSNFPPGAELLVAARRANDREQLLAVASGEASGNSASGRWTTKTGPNPTNPTPVTLIVHGLGERETSPQELEIEVPAPTLQAGTKLNRSIPQMTNQLQPDGTYQYVQNSGGATWGWDYGHELQIENNIFKVTCKIKLVGRGSARVTNKKKRAWKREIENIWNNKWRVHRSECQRGEDCDCHGGCCLFRVQIVCEFVDSGEYAEVEVWPGNPCDYGAHTKWWNSGTWFMGLCGHEGNGNAVRAHEFGHTMGLYDEYATGALWVPTNAAGNITGQPPNPNVSGSLMCDGTDINENHLDEFHAWFEDTAGETYNREPLT